jgi:hypothetical protein
MAGTSGRGRDVSGAITVASGRAARLPGSGLPGRRFTDASILRFPSRAMICVALLTLAPWLRATEPSDASTVRGTVFVDRDRDGIRDAGEPGIAGVKVSNGRELARTDARGRYHLSVRPGDTVFVIKPAGMDAPRGDDGLPLFWKHHFPTGSPALRYGGIAPTRVRDGDFALFEAREAIAAPLEVLVFGDPQVSDARQLDFFERDIVAPLEADPAASLGLSLGDIANDDLAIYPGIKQAMARLALPWLHLPGNHDLDFDATSDGESLLSWRAQFGPDTFAWEEREASFILLDDVIWQPGASRAYVGGLREDQFAFLEAYLADLPDSRALVLAAHIPLHGGDGGGEGFRRADRERLFALLARFDRVLLLTSHAHAQRHYFHGPADGWHGSAPLHEYVVGAACGGFWSGLPDAEGIPDARMKDGTPNGYARLRLSQDPPHLRWHAARDPADTRIALHAPRVLRRGAYPAFAVSANVFMGMDDTRVEYRIDAGEWKPMRRVARPDPALLAINAADDAADRLRSFDRAVEAAESSHLWRGALPTDLATGEHRIEVRAFDRWDGELRASTLYRLDEAGDLP